MHICFISPCQFNEFTGGIDRVCCQLIRELLKQGIQISSLYLHRSLSAGEPRVEYRQFPCPESAAATDNIEYLHNFVLEEKVDIVWLHTCIQDQFKCAKHAIQETSAKLVFTFHSDPVAPLVDLSDSRDYSKMQIFFAFGFRSLFQYIYKCFKYPIGYFLRKRHLQAYYYDIVNHCDLVTFLSKSAKRRFSFLVGRKVRARLAVVLNPIDIAVDISCAKKKQILFVGRLVWQKRVDRLLKSWRKLQNMFPDWSIVIVGAGPDEYMFQQIANRLKIERIYFMGIQPSLRYYKESAIVCIPSSHEGLPMVALESIANGCVPVFYDSIHSLVELLGCETAAKSWCVDSLAKVLEEAMTKNNLIRGFYDIDIRKFSASEIVRNYLTLLETI